MHLSGIYVDERPNDQEWNVAGSHALPPFYLCQTLKPQVRPCFYRSTTPRHRNVPGSRHWMSIRAGSNRRPRPAG
jgi:hypothetical protein